MAPFFGSSWFEDDKPIGPMSNWLEGEDDFSYGDISNYPCDSCIHNGRCDRQRDISEGDDCDQWSENKKR